MTTRAEDVLYSSLTDPDRLEVIAKVGLDTEVLPTPTMRPVVQWALDYFDQSSQTQAPSREALIETWGDVIDQAEVDIVGEDQELDQVTWAVQSVKSRYIHWRFQEWQRDSAMKMAESTSVDRLTTLDDVATDLLHLTLRVRDRSRDVEGLDGIRASLAAYHRRAQEAGVLRGMTFGIPTLDEYTFGIHEGEVATLAAGPKTGKSVAMAWVLLNEWRLGRIASYYTLENSVEMSYDRLICMMFSIDHDDYRRGQCTPEQIERVQTFLHERGDEFRERIRIVRPDRSKMTVKWLMRHARSHQAQSVLIDQLTFISPSHRSLRGPDAIKDIMHDLKDEASYSSHSVPVLLAHQINREGVKQARDNGRLEMWMLAEGSEVERSSDWIFGLYASDDERMAQMIKWQTLAGRRASELKSWRLAWRPWIGQVDTLAELEMAA